MTRGTDHERNDRIEATVIVGALATLGLLVAIAVSTSMSAVTAPDLQATTEGDTAPIPARSLGGIDPTGAQLQGSELR